MRRIALTTVVIVAWLVSCSPQRRERGPKQRGVIRNQPPKRERPVRKLSRGELIELGKKLFAGKGSCIACHEIHAVHIGPSLVRIAGVYREKKGDIVKFLRGTEKALVVPAQYGIMKTNFVITQKMSKRELQALEAFIMSCDK